MVEGAGSNGGVDSRQHRPDVSVARTDEAKHGVRQPIRPEVWFTLSLLASAGVGAVVLAQPACLPIEAEQFRWFWARHYWQCAFDALSAVCGVGLLAHDLTNDYTPAGRWVLWGLGQVGALLFLTAAASAARRYLGASDSGRSGATVGAMIVAPRWRDVLLAYGLLQLGLVLLIWAAGRVACPTLSVFETLFVVGGAFSGLGLAGGTMDAGTGLTVAIVCFVTGLGFAAWVWLLPIAGLARPLKLARVGWAAVGLAAWTASCAFLLCGLEAPRGESGGGGAGQGGASPASPPSAQAPLAQQPIWPRLTRSIVQAASAATVGIATESARDDGLRDGSKALLGGLMLIGALPGSPGGGIKWGLLLGALAAGGLALRRAPRGQPMRHDNEATRDVAGRWMRAGVAAVVLLTLATLATALGLLLIEAGTATRFQPPPTFADAWLDAASAVNGGNLTSGLAATVTSPNLTRGLGLPIDLYQIGTVWLMLAMLIGRVLPVWVVARAAKT